MGISCPYLANAIKLLVECIDILQTITPANIAKGIRNHCCPWLALLSAAAIIIGKFTI